jgi:hypothetical protein
MIEIKLRVRVEPFPILKLGWKLGRGKVNLLDVTIIMDIAASNHETDSPLPTDVAARKQKLVANVLCRIEHVCWLANDADVLFRY